MLFKGTRSRRLLSPFDEQGDDFSFNLLQKAKSKQIFRSFLTRETAEYFFEFYELQNMIPLI